MNNKLEIERKFIVHKLPNGLNEPIQYERYYLVRKNEVEIRIQKKGQKYELERKVETSNLTRKGQKFEITQIEFDELKSYCTEAIIRESYLIPNRKGGSVKVYKGKFEGLIRAEFEFGSEESARNFTKPDWAGQEITDTPLGRDSRLLGLGEEEFRSELSNYE